MNILVLDNYDSFTYNLVHYIEDVTGEIPDVYRNDDLFIDEFKDYDAIILSPGPGLPNEAGILKEVIKTYAGKIPMLGVCLGLQAIFEVFGGKLENLEEVFHGVASPINISKNDTIFKGLNDVISVARYHSWVASSEGFPSELIITATDEHQKIMALEHQKYLIYAVQFHPESILTPSGKQIIKNFIELIK